MNNKYTYKIRKRKPNESLNGYGYEMIIYKDKKIVNRTGAYSGIAQAREWFDTYIAID